MGEHAIAKQDKRQPMAHLPSGKPTNCAEKTNGLGCEIDRVQVASEGKRSETWVRVKRSMNPKKRSQKVREREKQGAALRHPIESAFRYGGTMPGPRKVHSRRLVSLNDDCAVRMLQRQSTAKQIFMCPPTFPCTKKKSNHRRCGGARQNAETNTS